MFLNLIICILLNAAFYMSVSTLAGDTICNMAYVRCMQAKLTLKVPGGAECRGRHDDLQLADQVLYGSIAGDAQRRKRGRSLLLRVVVSWRR